MIVVLYIVIGLLIALIIGQNILHRQEISSIEKINVSLIEQERKNAIKKSKDITRGHINEEFIPLFPDFPYSMSDCKFSGQPIDYIIYRGMSELRDGLEADVEIIFADVKTNTAQRTKIQNAIKKAVENGRVRFETWKIDNNKKIIIK